MIGSQKFENIWSMSKYFYGAMLIIVGLDKFAFMTVDWNIYVSPQVAALINPTTLIYILGVMEIGTGIAILTKWPRFGAYFMAAWIMGAIGPNLLMTGTYYDIIVRDVMIAFGFFVFAKLTEIRELREEQQQP